MGIFNQKYHVTFLFYAGKALSGGELFKKTKTPKSSIWGTVSFDSGKDENKTAFDLSIGDHITAVLRRYISEQGWPVEDKFVDPPLMKEDKKKWFFELPIDTKWVDSETGEDETEEWLAGVIEGLEKKLLAAKNQLKIQRKE